MTANLWLDNPTPAADLAVLAAEHPDVIGLNEARNHSSVVESTPGYLTVHADEVPAGTQNPILLRRATTLFLGSGAERMCEPVGKAPERWAVYALFEVNGVRFAYVNTHMNSHVENDGRPFPLPRVGQYVDHVHRLSALVRSLRVRDYRVIVGGDLNWAWTPGVRQSAHSPHGCSGGSRSL